MFADCHAAQELQLAGTELPSKYMEVIESPLTLADKNVA